jgi:hypothetical protein
VRVQVYDCDFTHYCATEHLEGVMWQKCGLLDDGTRDVPKHVGDLVNVCGTYGVLVNLVMQNNCYTIHGTPNNKI